MFPPEAVEEEQKAAVRRRWQFPQVGARTKRPVCASCQFCAPRLGPHHLACYHCLLILLYWLYMEN